jgi:putative transposase
MVRYRRSLVPGASYFFTVALRDRHARVLTDHVELLRQSVHEVRSAMPFGIVAMTILPEHFHAVWTLPFDDAAYASRLSRIKARFGDLLVASGVPVRRNRRGERLLWQRRFWEHTICDDEDLRRHVDYCHYNPVKHGWALRPVDWPYSSIHRHIRLGWCTADWAADPGDSAGGDRHEP